VAKGIKEQGGIVDFVHREIVMECLPADIPEHITIDVTELMLHDGVRVRDIDTGGKWKPISERTC
jgi:large subunit ribosomal protein L25